MRVPIDVKKLIFALLVLLFAVGCGVDASAGDAPAEPPPEAPVDDQAIDGRYRLGEALTHAGLTLYPILDTQAPERPEGDFDLLGDALKAGTLVVEEAGEGGTVPTLQVRNSGAKPVLITAGEVVSGGKQDRIIISDLVVPNNGQATDISVNCVESGRWSAGTSGKRFSYAGKGEATLKETVQLAKSQGQTWSKVSDLNAKKAEVLQKRLQQDEAEVRAIAAPPTSTYMAGLSSSHVAELAQPYIDALQPPLAEQGSAVGVVMAIDGKLESAELFGHPALFAKSRDQLVRSYAFEAVTEEAGVTGSTPPSPGDAGAFVREALTAAQTGKELQALGYVEEVHAEGSKSYRLKNAEGDLLHINAYAE